MGESKCQRSKTTGALLVVMPKVNPKESTFLHAAAPLGAPKGKQSQQSQQQRGAGGASKAAPAPRKLTLQEQMMATAMEEQGRERQPSAAVDIASIVSKPKAKPDSEEGAGSVFELPAAPRAQALVTEID